MTFLIDIIFVLIIAIAGYMGYRRGIVKMLLSLLIIVISLTVAWGISGPLAQGTYDLFFEDKVSRAVDEALENTTESAVDSAVEKLLDEDGVVGGLGSLAGFDTQKVIDKVAGNSLETVGETLKTEVIEPPLVLLLRCVLFLLLFAGLWVACSFMVKTFHIATKLPGVKDANAICGAIMGILIGVLLCMAFSILLNQFVLINPQGLMGITQITKENSIVYRLISNLAQAVL